MWSSWWAEDECLVKQSVQACVDVMVLISEEEKKYSYQNSNRLGRKAGHSAAIERRFSRGGEWLCAAVIAE